MKIFNFHLYFIMINIILTFNTSLGASVDIDCDTINRPLQEIVDAVEEDSYINLYGSCYDSIRVRKDRLSIVGKPNLKFILPSTAPFGIAISGRQINVEKINISGGKRGIVIYRGGSAEVSNSRITDSESIGIEVTESSYIRIKRTEVTHSHRNGVVIRLSSSADIHDNRINKNKGYGIVVDASAADIDGNLISRGGRYGILLRGGSKIRLGRDNYSGKANVFYENLIGEIRCESNSVIEMASKEVEFDYNFSDSCVLTNLSNNQ